MDSAKIMRDSEEFVRLSEEERRQSVIDSLWKATRTAVRQIVINRRSAELTLGISKEEFDEELNKICDEFNKKYGSMSEDELGKAMLMEIIERLEF